MSDFIDTAIREASISLHTEPADKANCFKCIMTSSYGTMTRTMTMREGYDAPPLGDLMLYYAETLQSVYLSEDILDWASEYEHDLTDNKTQSTFEGLVKNEADMRILLGDKIYRNMMTGLEIHQAISRARPR